MDENEKGVQEPAAEDGGAAAPSANRADEAASAGGAPGADHAAQHLRHTRFSAAWAVAVVAVVVGVGLVDFIAQNTRDVRVNFFTASGTMPIAVALLAAALAGALVVVAIGVGRVTQLRLGLRRQRRQRPM